MPNADVVRSQYPLAAVVQHILLAGLHSNAVKMLSSAKLLSSLYRFTIRNADVVVQPQQALRAAADLGPEQFPLSRIVRMVSDEIEILRSRG